MAHPGSSTLPEGTLHTIDANDKAIRVSGLTGITLSVGDHISIIGNVYQVMEDAVAVSGLTPLFEVRPHIWTGTAISDVVKISKPSCQMTVDPGSVSTNADPKTGRGTISFSATEARG